MINQTEYRIGQLVRMAKTPGIASRFTEGTLVRVIGFDSDVDEKTGMEVPHKYPIRVMMRDGREGCVAVMEIEPR